MKKLNEFIKNQPIKAFLLVLGIICAPGIVLGLFEVGKEVGQTLVTLLK
ncbi:MAG: hypothetical protein Q4B80_03315 [Aerococcaceae bacterium]|nr:hypothetical protein [Aerococcaceae bacterium]